MLDSSCSNHNTYRYGIDGVENDLAYVTSRVSVETFLNREVHVFIGEDDTEELYLDKHCKAMAQGRNRYERAMNYYNIHKDEFNAQNLHLHTVPGVGHSTPGMYGSIIGRKLLFSASQSDPENGDSNPRLINGKPVCQSDFSDPDGDGWGWENNQSCIVQ